MTDDPLRAALDAYMKEHPHWLDPEEDGCATGAAVRAALASAPDEGPRYSVEIVSRFSAAPAALDVERLLSAAHNHSWSNDCNLDGHNAGGGPAAGDECAECEHILDEYAARYGARPATPAALDVDKTSLDAAWETGYHEGVRRSRLTSVTEWLGPCCTHPEPGCVTCGFVPDAALRAEEPTR